MVQVNTTPLNLRLKFSKLGRLSYISHLDLVRTMNKIVVRAKLPLWYTEGFNPKPKMVFAVPLSIGTESVVEFMDIRLTERADTEEILTALNKNSTGELEFLEAYYPTTKLTEMKWISYLIEIKTVGATEDTAQKIESFLNSDGIEIVKKTKSGELKTVAVSDLVRSASAVLTDGVVRINCDLSGDQSAFLNPENLITALRDELGILQDECIVNEWYSIKRVQAFTEQMEVFR